VTCRGPPRACALSSPRQGEQGTAPPTSSSASTITVRPGSGRRGSFALGRRPISACTSLTGGSDITCLPAGRPLSFSVARATHPGGEGVVVVAQVGHCESRLHHGDCRSPQLAGSSRRGKAIPPRLLALTTVIPRPPATRQALATPHAIRLAGTAALPLSDTAGRPPPAPAAERLPARRASSGPAASAQLPRISRVVKSATAIDRPRRSCSSTSWEPLVCELQLTRRRPPSPRMSWGVPSSASRSCRRARDRVAALEPGGPAARPAQPACDAGRPRQSVGFDGVPFVAVYSPPSRLKECPLCSQRDRAPRSRAVPDPLPCFSVSLRSCAPRAARMLKPRLAQLSLPVGLHHLGPPLPSTHALHAVERPPRVHADPLAAACRRALALLR